MKSTRSLSSLLFKALLAVVIAACIYGIYLGGRWMLGDINAYPARYAIKAWEKSQDLPEPAEIDDLIARIDTALGWEARNPEYYDLRGTLLYAKALSLYQRGEAYPVEVFADAVLAHRTALSYRPTWPYSWSNLALMKAYAGQFDAEQSEALLKANQFGPWELPVQVNIVQAGLMSWNTLTQVDRLIVAANVQKGLRYTKRRDITQLVQRYQRVDEICTMLNSDKTTRQLCGKRG